ncbi:acyltransferase family protein [Methylobacterium sp. sgz302541]|uniref:acyltransferase family protein n=1 Tax=unclassified Methylobacterium TaxID=2615210 RepID=UPI003D34D4F8
MRGYRYEALDGVRALAAQTVLVSHGLGMAYFLEHSPGAAAAEWFGRLSVMVFFSLSGFVIATSLSRLVASEGHRFAVPYAVHRIARIWPPLALAILVTFAVGWLGHNGLPLLTKTGDAYRLDLVAFLRGLTLTFAPGDATFVIDRALWSLRQEVYLYAVAAFAAWAIVGRGVRRGLGALAVLALVGVTADRFFYLQSLALFSAGAAAALYGTANLRLRAVAASPVLPPVTLLLLAAPLAFVGDPGFIDAMSEGKVFLAYQAALGVPVALCLLRLATSEGPASRFFMRLSGAAAFSYTLYVIHVPVMTLVFSLRAHLGVAPGLAGTTATLVAALLAAEAASWAAALLVERPRFFRKLLFRLLGATGLARQETRFRSASSV